jgi:hypothetical protein
VRLPELLHHQAELALGRQSARLAKMGVTTMSVISRLVRMSCMVSVPFAAESR